MPQKKDTIPTSKMKRSTIAGASMAKVGVKHLTFLGKSTFTSTKNKETNKEQHEKEIGQILIATFSQLRGTALKIAQVLSMEADFFPKSIRDELLKACHQVIPLNQAHIRKVFMKDFGQSPEQIFKNFNGKAFAAASLGQVHLAESETGEPMAIKIQYPGIDITIQSDLKLMRGVLNTLQKSTSLLPPKAIIDSVLNEIGETAF